MTSEQLKPLTDEIAHLEQRIKDRQNEIELLLLQQKADQKKVTFLQEGIG